MVSFQGFGTGKCVKSSSCVLPQSWLVVYNPHFSALRDTSGTAISRKTESCMQSATHTQTQRKEICDSDIAYKSRECQCAHQLRPLWSYCFMTKGHWQTLAMALLIISFFSCCYWGRRRHMRECNFQKNYSQLIWRKSSLLVLIVLFTGSQVILHSYFSVVS